MTKVDNSGGLGAIEGVGDAGAAEWISTRCLDDSEEQTESIP